MALPKIDQPTFELIIPSTKEKITYRPFVVKEEKILLIGLESGEHKDMVRAIKQIIRNCVSEPIDIDKLASFDLEYLFLQLRSKSVSETVDLIYPCKACRSNDINTKIEFSVDLNNIEITETPGHTNDIKITDTIGVILKYPTLIDVQHEQKNEFEAIINLIANCIDMIYDADNINHGKDISKEDKTAWLESLSQNHFTLIQEFFTTMPKISHEVELECPKCKTVEKVVLEGLQSFFG